MNAYLILDFTIHDFKMFKEYIRKIPSFIEKPTVMEGDWNPERVVVIEFPSRENAKEFLKDPDAQSLFSIRHKTTTSKLILVDGCF